MSNQVGDCFKFLWPFQNDRTLKLRTKNIVVNDTSIVETVVRVNDK